MRIEKKVWPEYFQKIIDGVKTYELRLADFECKPGDILVLKEWDPKTKQYTGRLIEKRVTYVGKTRNQKFWPEEDVKKYGFQIIAFRQEPFMEEKDLKEVLRVILDSLKGKEFTWRVEGSANMLIQGMSVPVKDLDITTNDDGIEIFRDALKEFIKKDFFSRKINGRSIICDIKGFEVEINAYGDREQEMFDKNEIKSWKGLSIPALPLRYAKEFYEFINRKDKVEEISKYLQKKT